MFCPHCGRELNETNICPNSDCPSNLIKTDEVVVDEIVPDSKEVTSDEIKEFIGEHNTYYYFEKWNIFKKNNNFKSWNWPAFLLSPWWFWYRKMYICTATLFLVNLLVKNIASESIYTTISLIINICSGIFANQIYMKFATQKIESIKNNEAITPELRMGKIQSTGGVTKAPIIVAIILLIIVVLCILFCFSLLKSILL